MHYRELVSHRLIHHTCNVITLCQQSQRFQGLYLINLIAFCMIEGGLTVDKVRERLISVFLKVTYEVNGVQNVLVVQRFQILEVVKSLPNTATILIEVFA